MAYPAEQALPNDGAWGSADRGRQQPSRAPAYLGTNAHCPSLPPPKQMGGSRGTLLQLDLKTPCMALFHQQIFIRSDCVSTHKGSCK